jgi:hypothetical protein
MKKCNEGRCPVRTANRLTSRQRGLHINAVCIALVNLYWDSEPRTSRGFKQFAVKLAAQLANESSVDQSPIKLTREEENSLRAALFGKGGSNGQSK